MPNYEKSQKEALAVLEKFQVDEPVVPVFDLAESLGLTVAFVDMPDDLGDVAGFFDPESKIIYVNHADPPTRQAFTTAHELGHYVLGHKPDEYGVLYRYSTPVDPDPVEQEANCFAANLLVPEEMLTRVMKQYELGEDDVELLARLFGVSSQVIKYRLKRLNG